MKLTMLTISLWLFSVMFFSTGLVGQTQNDSVSVVQKPSKSPKAALFYSLLPGGGQLYNRQWIKSLLVIGGQTALVYYSIQFDRKADKELPGSLDHSRFIDRRNLMYWLMGGVVLLSMLDAYIDAHLFDFDAGPELSLRIGEINEVGPAPEIGLSLRAHF